VKVVNKTIFAGFVALMLVSKITCANAQQLGTAEEARAMLDRAISALKTDEDKALTEFNDPNDKQFHDRDLYVAIRSAKEHTTLFTRRRQGVRGLYRHPKRDCHERPYPVLRRLRQCAGLRRLR
jgi:hypothetical protein